MQGIVIGLASRVNRVWIIFEKHGAHCIGQRRIQYVLPDHRLVSVVTMIMPGPVGGNNKITKVHLQPFAIDRGKGAINTFQY